MPESFRFSDSLAASAGVAGQPLQLSPLALLDSTQSSPAQTASPDDAAPAGSENKTDARSQVSSPDTVSDRMESAQGSPVPLVKAINEIFEENTRLKSENQRLLETKEKPPVVYQMTEARALDLIKQAAASKLSGAESPLWLMGQPGEQVRGFIDHLFETVDPPPDIKKIRWIEQMLSTGIAEKEMSLGGQSPSQLQ